MYNDEEGRKWILKKLGQFNSTAKVKKLSFFMYSFYSHLSTKSQESPEFSFVGKYQYVICKVDMFSKGLKNLIKISHLFFFELNTLQMFSL